MLVGWYAQIPVLTRVSPSFVAMQFNTAVALGLISLALLGHARHGSRWTIVPALLALALGSATLVEHITGTSLRIDLVLFHAGVSESMRPLTEFRQPAPGRMAPNSALSLALLGLALSFRRRTDAHAKLAALQLTCCLVPAVLGFVAATGYLLGIPTAYGWGHLTRMALHTAVAITLLGIGAAAVVTANARRAGLRMRRWAPFVAGAVGVAISLALWQALADVERRLMERDLTRQAAGIAGELDATLRERARLAQGLTSDIGAEAPAATMTRESARARALFRDIMSVGWADGNGVRWFGESAPIDVVRAAAQDARGTGPSLSPPYVAASGETRVLLIAPGDRTTYLVISPRMLADSSLQVNSAHATALAITDGRRPLVSSPASRSAWAKAAEVDAAVTLLGRRWDLRVRPADDAFAGVTSRVPVVFLVSALLASMLAALSVRTLQRERAQAEALAVTARELAERRDEVEAANRAKSDFLARMSHELRTPLNSVIGFAKVVLRRNELTERDNRLVDRIQSNGLHLLALINQVLDIAKIESGHESVTLAPTDVRLVVESAIASFDIPAGDGGGRLSSTMDADVPLVMTDGYKLLQVLINLIGNAVKFSSAHGRVEVRVGGGARPWIEVRDYGIGIPADRIHVIFDAFEQAGPETSRIHGGTGLGLAISRNLCTLMGHSLTVTSTPGEGSTFTIWLTPPA